jgi:HK97 family phage prohead protease
MQRLACSLREVKLAPGKDDAMTFAGYGAVFNNVDSYGDVIMPGAFAAFLADVKSGKQNWPAMLSQHGGWGMGADDMTPIGVWTELSEDGTGLKVEGKLADTPRGRELYALMKMEPRPAIDGLSIGYIPKEFEMRTKPDEPRRKLKRIDLIEISPVTFPANGKARVGSVKSLEELSTLSEIETFLREAGGFSRNEAKALIARIKSASPREADGDLAQLTAALTGVLNTVKGKSQ